MTLEKAHNNDLEVWVYNTFLSVKAGLVPDVASFIFLLR